MIARIAQTVARLFVLWTVLGVAYAWFVPAHFTWFLPHIPLGLGLIMLGMGITLTPADFVQAIRRPAAIGLGLAAQFAIMPLLGWSIASALALPPGLAAGLILVSCCPGGTASNLVTHLANGNTALSVLFTTASTLAAVALTPWLTWALAGSHLPVDGLALLADTLKVVLLPVLIGIALNRFFPRAAAPLASLLPALAALLIVLIVGAIVGNKRAEIAQAAPSLLAAVFLLHAGGFGLGFAAARLLRQDASTARALSIEVGMQNSGLGATLARNLPDPLAPVPSALSAVCHCLLGSALAAIWRRRPLAPPPS